ncbi:unnamed protein product [Schistosoma mattheei]|uniref:Uncharacterized protein n=1 Tax=Schistosoma mattheei TaxID=31246 RepID=A0A183NN70_9TREM|nr:unnamed protein product [Schistosoma mattheei]
MYSCLLLACSVGDSTPVELTPCGPHGQFDEDASLHSGVDGENDLSNYPDWKSPSLQSEEDGCNSIQDGTVSYTSQKLIFILNVYGINARLTFVVGLEC